MKIQKKNWGGVPGVGLGCQGGCERRIEVIVKIQKKKIWGGGEGGGRGRVGGGGVRVDVIDELKFLGKFTKKNGGGWGCRGGGGGRVGLGDQGGCDLGIEVFGKIQKKNLFFFRGGSG